MSQQIDKLYGLMDNVLLHQEGLTRDDALAINAIIQERIDVLREEWCSAQDECDLNALESTLGSAE
jgi:hypothetical protein